jgi:hypothetical protein
LDLSFQKFPLESFWGNTFLAVSLSVDIFVQLKIIYVED